MLFPQFGIRWQRIGTRLARQSNDSDVQTLIPFDDRFVSGFQVFQLRPDHGGLLGIFRRLGELPFFVKLFGPGQHRDTTLLQSVRDRSHLRVIGIKRSQPLQMVVRLRVVFLLRCSQCQRLQHIPDLVTDPWKILLQGIEFLQRHQSIFQPSLIHANLCIGQEQRALLLQQARPVWHVL